MDRVVFAIAVLATLAVAGPHAFGQSQTGFTYNGIVRAVYSDNDLGTSGDATYVSFVQDSGANYVAITIEWFVQSASGTTIAPNSSDSATDAQIIAAIQNYHNLGIKVVLKPHVDVINYTTWRGELDPTSVSAWFTSYQAYITHYATIAQEYGVDGLSIGTELKSLSGSNNLSYWQTLIAAVRSDYTGPIMYGANATGNGDEYSTVSFWSLVDILGVDGYFGLTGIENPTIAQLEAAWTDNDSPYTGSGFDAVAALKNLNTTYDKPVVFTEVGYESSAGTNEEPYAEISNGYDPTEQENCYTAFFNVFSQQSSWMKGVFWWSLQLPVPGADDQGWVPYGKPAGTVVLPLWYKGTPATSTATMTASPNPATVGQPVTLKATVSGTVGSPTGNVSFLYDNIDTVQTVALTSGAASYSASTEGLLPGSYSLSASYPGSTTYTVSNSPAYVVTLNAAPTATTITATPTQVTPPGNVTLTATVTRTASGATGTPTGTVTFYYMTQALGTAQLNNGVAVLTGPAPVVPAGSYVVTAQYSGDSRDTGSTTATGVTITLE